MCTTLVVNSAKSSLRYSLPLAPYSLRWYNPPIPQQGVTMKALRLVLLVLCSVSFNILASAGFKLSSASVDWRGVLRWQIVVKVQFVPQPAQAEEAAKSRG